MFDYESVFKWTQWLWCWGRKGAQHAASSWGLTVRRSERIAAVIHCSFCWKIYKCRNVGAQTFQACFSEPFLPCRIILSNREPWDRFLFGLPNGPHPLKLWGNCQLRKLLNRKYAKLAISILAAFGQSEVWLPIYLSVYLSWKKTCWLAPTLFQHVFCHHCKLAPFDLWLGFLLLTAKRNAAVPLSFSTIQCPEWKTNYTPCKTIN